MTGLTELCEKVDSEWGMLRSSLTRRMIVNRARPHELEPCIKAVRDSPWHANVLPGSSDNDAVDFVKWWLTDLGVTCTAAPETSLRFPGNPRSLRCEFTLGFKYKFLLLETTGDRLVFFRTQIRLRGSTMELQYGFVVSMVPSIR